METPKAGRVLPVFGEDFSCGIVGMPRKHSDLVAAQLPFFHKVIDPKILGPKVLAYDKNPQMHLTIFSTPRGSHSRRNCE